MIELVYNSIKQMKQDAFIRKANEDTTYWLIPDNRIVTGIRINIRKEVKIMKKNFKKIAAVALSCVLTLGMTVNAFAADPDKGPYGTETKDLIDSRGTSVPDGAKDGMKNVIDNFPTGNSTSRDVKVTVAAPTEVYKVDVIWEATSFTFKYDVDWDPESHQYGSSSTGKFYIGDDVKNTTTVTLKNHSNKPVNVAYAYTAASDTKGFSATLSKTSGSLATAEKTAVNSAPSDSATLTLSGVPNAADVTEVVIGTITVTVSKASS